MSTNLTVASTTPGNHANYHPQSTAVGRPVQGGFRFFGNVFGIILIVLIVKVLEGIPLNLSALQQSLGATVQAAGATAGKVFLPEASSSEDNTYALPRRLYLMEKASLFVSDEEAFENKVRDISSMLGVAPVWLMAVMYSESKFDAAVQNYKGSGATGLIQFMETTAQEMNISLERLGRMNHLQQLEYVYLYLQTVRDRYGDYESLTDLYLAVLYPKARGQEFCYTLYARPSSQYNQNSGLDENKDGRVTISDIDRRMKRLYPSAYMAEPPLS